MDDIMIMMDQLSLHTSKATKKLMDELNFHYTYTPVYQPQYNGIEEVINMGKKMVRKTPSRMPASITIWGLDSCLRIHCLIRSMVQD